MADYDNTNRGAIWKNERRETDKHPHFQGSLDVEGVEYWVSAWKRDPGANPKSPALRFSIKRKEQAHNEGMAAAQRELGEKDFNDDIPF